ncbi:MAG: substrate-binding domain-containing protein [Verrucomicrobiota bacterium]
MKRSQSSRIKRIAVIGMPMLQVQSRFNAALMSYAATKGNWKFIASIMEVSVENVRILRRFHCDGALVRVISPAIARETSRLPFPIVNFSSWLAKPGVPTVQWDNTRASQLAAQHLLQKGFRRFGVVVSKGGWFTHPRYTSFLNTVEKAGFGANISTFRLQHHPADAGDLRRFRKWVAGLQSPVGLFLVNDDPDAPALMDACRAAGKNIPRDVAVITSPGHPEICPFCQPPLTHVDSNEEGVALEAAKLLDRLMSGEKIENQIVSVHGGGLIALGSTDTMAVEDPSVTLANEFIRMHISEPISIKNVAQYISVPRRTLERHFRAAMGVSLHDFLARERIERAQDLLKAVPRLTLKEVADRCGFTTISYLNTAFRLKVGMSPQEWRLRFSRD